MSDSYDPLYERAINALEQIPTMTEMSGCVDCGKVFRIGAECPYCGSESILNLAQYIGGGKQ